MKIRRLIVAAATAAAVALPAIALGASSAGAAGYTTNFPGNNTSSPAACNAWHGAPGGLGVNSPYYWVRNDPGFGQEQGVVTGQDNANACK